MVMGKIIWLEVRKSIRCLLEGHRYYDHMKESWDGTLVLEVAVCRVCLKRKPLLDEREKWYYDQGREVPRYLINNKRKAR